MSHNGQARSSEIDYTTNGMSETKVGGAENDTKKRKMSVPHDQIHQSSTVAQSTFERGRSTRFGMLPLPPNIPHDPLFEQYQ